MTRSVSLGTGEGYMEGWKDGIRNLGHIPHRIKKNKHSNLFSLNLLHFFAFTFYIFWTVTE